MTKINHFLPFVGYTLCRFLLHIMEFYSNFAQQFEAHIHTYDDVDYEICGGCVLMCSA